MPTIDTLEAGREYTDDEVEALDPHRQPNPVQPFAYNHPAPRPRVGLSRKSAYGDRWCPFCQTPLDRSSRMQACPRCREIRDETIERTRGGSSIATAAPAPGQSQNHRDLGHLLDAIDEMARVVAVASAMQNRGGGLTVQQTEDMFFACKDVMVAADPLRRRLQGGD